MSDYITPVMYSDVSGYAPEWLKDAFRFVSGALITVVGASLTLATLPLLLVPGLSSIPLLLLSTTIYGTMLTASPFSSKIKTDMNRISWNPFNGDANAVANSKDISFYKGVFVFRYGSSGGGGISFGIIGLGRGASVNTVIHE
jgi:hypothetical protein